jgi:hypothetical protein
VTSKTGSAKTVRGPLWAPPAPAPARPPNSRSQRKCPRPVPLGDYVMARAPGSGVWKRFQELAVHRRTVGCPCQCPNGAKTPTVVCAIGTVNVRQAAGTDQSVVQTVSDGSALEPLELYSRPTGFRGSRCAAAASSQSSDGWPKGSHSKLLIVHSFIMVATKAILSCPPNVCARRNPMPDD